MHQAAQGTAEVSAHIASVKDAAQETGTAAALVMGSAGKLAKNGATLRHQVDEFLREVRAA